jgi:hypothetical protein
VFPSLGSYIDHSLPTRRYNCYAFAAGDSGQRWEPDPAGLYYWPPNIRRDYSPEAFAEAYGTLGYAMCRDGTPEIGYEKIALYVGSRGIVEHAARELMDGSWISKLGNAEDIIHQTPGALTSVTYGVPVHFLRRKIELQTMAHGWFGKMWMIRA